MTNATEALERESAALSRKIGALRWRITAERDKFRAIRKLLKGTDS